MQSILDRGGPSFQNIWGPDAKNSDIAHPFKQLIATFPVFLVAAGYSAGGKTHSLLMPNINDPRFWKFLSAKLYNKGTEKNWS